MTNEEIRIKVAESLGWKPDCDGAKPWLRQWLSPCVTDPEIRFLPNFPESLDACAEFEKTIKAIHIYNEQLEIVVLGHPLRGRDAVAEFMLRCATPRQRCLAYLKTKNLIP